MNFIAYITITVDYSELKKGPKTQEELAKKIKVFPCIEGIAIVTGEVDIIMKVKTKDIEELKNFIIRDLRSLAGIDKTQTFIVLTEQ